MVKSSEVLRLAAELCQKGEMSPIIEACNQFESINGAQIVGYATRCGYYQARDENDINNMCSSLIIAARHAEEAGDLDVFA